MISLSRLMGAASAAILAAAASAAVAQDLPPQPPQLPPIPAQPAPGAKYVTYPVRAGVYMITTPGGNVAVQVGPDGVLVVDTGAAGQGAELLAEIRKLSNKPVRFIVNTNGDPDHIGGNVQVAKAGELLEGGNTRPTAVSGSGGAPIWAHEGTLTRLASGATAEGLPSDSYFVAQKDLFFNGEPVSLVHAKDAHTSGDSLVVFRRSDVIAAGDVFTPDRYPNLDLANGGSIQGYLDGLNHLLRLTIPEFNQQGGTFVIPGHGRLSDEADVGEYRDMVTFIRDRVQDMVKRRMTLAQVKAANPTFDYDPLYGAEAGAVFVEQVYRSLTQGQGGQRR
jgi:glyoxylase-like metal-dependent hydrolase (beta-lactamase superfamily II)